MEALVDPVSSASNFGLTCSDRLVRKLRQARPADMVLRKYSRGQIPISGQVDLEFSWKGKMIVSPVHICSDKEKVSHY